MPTSEPDERDGNDGTDETPAPVSNIGLMTAAKAWPLVQKEID